jgi:hypothetical protein
MVRGQDEMSTLRQQGQRRKAKRTQRVVAESEHRRAMREIKKKRTKEVDETSV